MHVTDKRFSTVIVMVKTVILGVLSERPEMEITKNKKPYARQ